MRNFYLATLGLLFTLVAPTAFSQNTVLTTSTALPGGGIGSANVLIGPANIYSGSFSGGYNTYVGKYAGINNTTGFQNSFTGSFAGYLNTTGIDNSFTGYVAGYSNTTGSYNSFSGSYAGFSNTTGSYNSFTGYQAGYSNTGGYNSFTGYQAGYSNTTGNYNSFSGSYAGNSNTTGTYNSFSGGYAGYSNTTGSNNSFSGNQAGNSNTTGVNNSFSGYQAGYSNTTGDDNSFSGSYAGFSNTTGGDNSFSGYQAGYSNTTGNYNSFSGSYAGAGNSNTTGSYNSFMGNYAGNSNTTGSNNSYFGNYSSPTGANERSLQRATALGYNAKVAVNDGLVLGDVNVKVGIGTSYPDQKLTIKGNMNFIAYDNSMMLKSQPFLHFNEHESLALGLGAEIAPGAEKTLVLGSKETTVQIPGIANTSPPHAGQFLTVDNQGNVLLSQPRVQVASVADWSDKVFEPGYALRPLGEVENFVKKNKHLPGVPSAAEMVAEGMESAAFNAKLLEKIEELTLYTLKLEKSNVSQQQQIDELRMMVLALKK